MKTLETLLPVMLLVGLGWGLARVRLLGPQFIADMNKLGFFVALPAFILQSMPTVRVPVGGAMRLFLLLLACTLIAVALAIVLGMATGARRDSLGSVAQAAFRGNLAFVALPVLNYALLASADRERTAALGIALLVFAPLTACYNLLAVLCLQKTVRAPGRSQWVELARSIGCNPLIIACAAGFAMAMAGLRFLAPVSEALKALGGIAMPTALLCIGGSLMSINLGGRYRSVGVGVAVKILLLPAIAWAGCEALGIYGVERLIVLIFAGSPTAATAFTMAKQMGGDETVTSACVMLSTLLAAPTLAVILTFGT